jgi:hypothetical protein
VEAVRREIGRTLRPQTVFHSSFCVLHSDFGFSALRSHEMNAERRMKNSE